MLTQGLPIFASQRLYLPRFRVMLVFALTGCFALPGLAQTQPRAWINELHYDNAGQDLGEVVELAGPAGTDLSGWRVALYNGSNGRVYGEHPLAGRLPDQQRGYGAVLVTLSRDGLQNGAPDGIALVDGAGRVVQFLSYEGRFVATDGPAQGLESTDLGLSELANTPLGLSLQLTGSGQTYAAFTWRQGVETYGLPNLDQQFADAPPQLGDCPDIPRGAILTTIPALQGPGFSSPLEGQSVTVRGTVTAVFAGAGGLGGFFLQDPVGDDDPRTSDGLFVAAAQATVETGQQVQVFGAVAETFGETTLESSEITPCGDGRPLAARPVELPPPPGATLEPYEGMLVTFPQDLTITDLRELARFGNIALSAGGRLFQPTQTLDLDEAGADAIRRRQLENRRRQLLLDDGSLQRNPRPVPYLEVGEGLRIGDSVSGLTGVLGFDFGTYRLHPVTVPGFTRDPRPGRPPEVGGTLRVASFNVLNYFNGPAFPTPRGARTQEEFQRQHHKIVQAVMGLDADIIGLMELENDGHGPDSAIAELVAGLNEASGEERYALIDPGSGPMGDDAIAVGLIYRIATVAPVNAAALLDAGVDPQFDDTKNRPTLAQSFREQASGQVVTVVVNHFKSKGSSCGVGDDDTAGQGNCNRTRTRAAQALACWLATDPTGGNSTAVLIVGDLNSYAEEDPIDALRAGGFIDLIQRHQGSDAYSYVFAGEAGYLDHALASESLVGQVTGVAEWHINADEASILDYRSDNPDGFYRPDVFRASDHDPVLIGLDLGAANDNPISDDLAANCAPDSPSDGCPP